MNRQAWLTSLSRCWRSDIRCLVFYSALFGIGLGVWISWWLNRPWIEFEYLQATYRLEASEIRLNGYYQVNRECNYVEGAAVWRNEAIATDGQVALYGPVPEPPPLTKGEHRLAMTIPLLAEIYPDGWVSSARVTCPGESPETVVSQLAKVIIVDEEETPP